VIGVFTPKGLHLEAQGRAAHPGLASPLGITPKGLHQQNPRLTPSRDRIAEQSLAIEGASMPQSLAQIYLHIVFSTKNRSPFLADPELLEETHRYLGGTCNRLECPVLRVGGVADHVHILCRLGRTISVADLIRELKRDSSQWLKTKGQPDFYWQNGYGAFSLSPEHVEPVREYIAHQEEHHREESFQDEFRRLLKEHGIEWDERYVWD
jgi:REP element-mobilizing transposase RayT